MSSKKKIILATSTILVVVSVLCFVLIGCYSTDNSSNNMLENNFSTEIIKTEGVALSVGPAFASESGGVSKTISATVLPETATNKKVDWSVAWLDTGKSDPIGNYLTVTPSSDGSTTATVTCIKAFTGEAQVTVTTRESGFTATCIVKFVGEPQSISVSGSLSPTSGNNYKVGAGLTYNFDVKPTNIFNSVGGDYNTITATVTGVGSINTASCEFYKKQGTYKWYDNNESIALDTIKDKFIAISCSGGKLTVTTKASIESYYGSSKMMDGGRTVSYTNKFKNYIDDCYFKITLTESKSGISKDIIIHFDDTVVTSVAMSQTEISF